MKGFLDRTRVYLIGHMEYKDGSDWRKKVTKNLEKMGVICFNPYEKPFENDIKEDEKTQERLKKKRAYDMAAVHEHMKEVVAFDLAMVDRSDFIICVINPEIPTYGTTHEIVVANLAKKPIFTVVEGGVDKTPLWLTGLLSPSCFYNSMEEVLEKLQGIHNGSIKTKSKRWRFLKYEYR